MLALSTTGMPEEPQQSIEEKAEALELPPWLTQQEEAYPTVFVDTGGVNLGESDSGTAARVNEAIFEALCAVSPEDLSGQVLIKVHVGEPKCATRMRPEYVLASVKLALEKGATGVVAGDTTVAYSGLRSHRENPLGDAHRYLTLAWKNGWSEAGTPRVPFVVMDRPSTAIPGVFRFQNEELRIKVAGIERYKDFHFAGAFSSAASVINNAHLTLHGLAGLAGCVKSVSMGCTSLRGKLRMHQSLLPWVDAERCEACGRCVDSCPEGALELSGAAFYPTVNPERCIGCGECEAVCARRQGAIRLRGHGITDWQRGAQTVPLRMSDYMIGLMNGKWDSTIHVLHMYSVTERCDCLNVRQQPITKRDLGFLVGKNPFAIDRLAAQMLTETLCEEGRHVDDSLLQSAEKIAAYVKDAYGVLSEGPLERISAL